MITAQLLMQAKNACKKKKFDKAEKILLSILASEINHREACDLLCMTYIDQKLYKKAIELLQRAIALNPTEATLYNNLGNVYTRTGDSMKAAENYIKSLSLDQKNANTHNNYGLLLYEQSQYTLAQEQFYKALSIQKNHIAAMYNLGLTLCSQNRTQEAAAYFESITIAEPSYYKPYFSLAKIFLKEKNFSKANEYLLKLTEIHKNNIEFLIATVNILLEHNRYQEAKPYAEKAQQLQPKNRDIIYNLAVIATKEVKLTDAIELYLSILSKNKNHFASLNNIAIIYLELQQNDKAIKHFRKALALQPENTSIKYTLDFLTQKSVASSAPTEYLKNLFDEYADHFDVHLQEGLNYRAPELLKEQIVKYKNPTKNSMAILDLGCGTGICGETFKFCANFLVGTDISSKMVLKAKEKNCYNETHVVENLHYLGINRNKFDLITAADVFVYQGDLEETFKRCNVALKKNGLLTFSIETCERKNYKLQTTGRFAHSINYIEELTKKTGFLLISKTISATRKQFENDVFGGIFVAEKVTCI